MSFQLLIAALVSAAQTQTIRVEGESYSRLGGPSQIRVVERSTASGGKVVSYWEEQGVWLEWEFGVPKAGAYAVSFRYACRWPDSHRRVEIDGNLPNQAGEAVRFGTTGDWAKHAVHTLGDENGVPIVLKLGAGKHRIRLSNVNSRGLAIDVIFVHDPAEKFADVALAEAEIATFRPLTLAQPVTQPTLNEREMCLGNVKARFDSGGLTSVWVTQTLFEVPIPAKARPSPKTRLGRTASLLARLQRHQSWWQLYVTDGQAFFVVVASPTARKHRVAFWPRAYSKGARLWESVVWRNDVGAHYPLQASVRNPATCWRVGQARVWGSAAFTPSAHAMHFAEPSRVAAVKICPVRWQEKGLAVKATPDAVLSSAEDYPGLAAFYGYGRFEVTFGWEGDSLRRCEVEDRGSRKHVQLWPPAR